MNFKLYDKKASKQELSFIMICLAVLCCCGIFVGLLDNLRLYLDLSKESTENAIWQILPESITLSIMVICSIIIGAILKNEKRNQIFTHNNGAHIMNIGGLIDLNGLILWGLSILSPVKAFGHGYMIYILIGLFFLFIGCVFKFGVKMKEEQDQTI